MITIQKREVFVYIGNTYLFGTPTDFSGTIGFISESRISYPWEGDIKSYTEEDAKALAMSYLKGNVSVNGSSTDPDGLLKFSQ